MLLGIILSFSGITQYYLTIQSGKWSFLWLVFNYKEL